MLLSTNVSHMTLISPLQFGHFIFLLLSCYPIFLFHLRYHLCELFLTFFNAAGVDVSSDAFAVHDWRVSTFPHVLADLMDRACSLPSILAFIRLKFRPWRGFGRFGRTCSSSLSPPSNSAYAPARLPIVLSMVLAAVRIPSSVAWEYTFSVVNIKNRHILWVGFDWFLSMSL